MGAEDGLAKRGEADSRVVVVIPVEEENTDFWSGAIHG